MNEVVVVPCFNEAQRIDLERFLALPRARVGLVFVDDGSTDETLSTLRAFVSGRPGLTVLALERNGGKGEAVRRGLLHAIEQGATKVGYLDADLATPPEEMLRVLGSLEGPVEIALGSRVALLGRNVERNVARHYLGRIFATAASQALSLRVYDTQCGAKAFSVTPDLKRALSQPFRSRWVFDVELLRRLLPPAPRPTQRIIEVPLLEWRDVKGSKLTPRAMARAAFDLLGLALRSPR